jgi:hypothetical protein
MKSAHAVAPCDKRSPRSCASFPKSGPSPAAEVSLLPAALWKARWQSPAWSSARHVCPRERAQSPRAQTRPLACSGLCLGACLSARVAWSFYRAWNSLFSGGRALRPSIALRSSVGGSGRLRSADGTRCSGRGLRGALALPGGAQLAFRFEPMFEVPAFRLPAFNENFIRAPRDLFLGGCRA